MAHVGVVICAHNEEKTLGSLLAAVSSCPHLGTINVVLDRCTDNSYQIARSFGVNIWNGSTGGKGTSMSLGLNGVVEPTVLFLDSDTSGMTATVLTELATYPINGQVLGIRHDAWALEKIGAFPSITGDRRVPTWLARQVPLEGSGWKAETLINMAVQKAGLPTAYVVMKSVYNPSRFLATPIRWIGKNILVGGFMLRHIGDIWPMRKAN